SVPDAGFLFGSLFATGRGGESGRNISRIYGNICRRAGSFALKRGFRWRSVRRRLFYVFEYQAHPVGEVDAQEIVRAFLEGGEGESGRDAVETSDGPVVRGEDQAVLSGGRDEKFVVLDGVRGVERKDEDVFSPPEDEDF